MMKSLLHCSLVTISGWTLGWAEDCPPQGGRGGVNNGITFRVATNDGASLYIKRYESDGPPVLCIHGLCANLRTFDLDPALLRIFSSAARF